MAAQLWLLTILQDLVDKLTQIKSQQNVELLKTTTTRTDLETKIE
jgi:hypothetical protein